MGCSECDDEDIRRQEKGASELHTLPTTANQLGIDIHLNTYVYTV